MGKSDTTVWLHEKIANVRREFEVYQKRVNSAEKECAGRLSQLDAEENRLILGVADANRQLA